MKVLAVIMFFSLAAAPTKFDFGNNQTIKKWKVVNDGVMGGLSTGVISYTKNTMLFKGEISLDNNGGFASIRTNWDKWDLSKFSKVKMRVKTNGRKYALVLETDKRFYKPTFKQDVTTKKGEWEILEFFLKDFYISVMGEPTGDKIEAEQLSQIIRMGFILFDKKAGDFSIEVDYIEFI